MSDDLPPRLAALIAGERDAPTGDRRRVRTQLATSLGIAAASSTAAASAIAAKLVVLALALGGGAAIVVHERHDATAEVAPPAPRIARSIEKPVPAPAPPVIAPPAMAVPAAPVRARAKVPVAVPVEAIAVDPPAATPAAPSETPIASRVSPPVVPDQRAVLALAWSALSRGDNRGALALLDQQGADHALDEERDALRVETLRRLGNTSDADREARAFLARFPGSIHRALVAQALTKESP